jgi:RNAse (barnase) inhibitor barstar
VTGPFLISGLRPGVQRWSSALDVAYVRGVVRRAGRRFAHVAGAEVATAAALHDALAAALDLPAYYGRNLDALEECLRDLGDLADAPVLLWDDWGVLAAAEPRTSRVVLELLDASAVTTLLRGEDPAVLPGQPGLTPPAG